MEDKFILGIESSCDETAASVINNCVALSNIIADQRLIHRYYGGVVPELASRAHQQKIIPVVEEALLRANITKNDLKAIAFTRGPGLMGALLVGTSFAKALAYGLSIPLLEVNHMQGHVLAHFIRKPGESKEVPGFPFLCLTVSGGHTQIVRVDDYLEMEVIGQTRDDAAGEAFDKAAKILGLPYPGGPLVDKHAARGNRQRFSFPIPHLEGLDFSFSGLKTAVLRHVKNAGEPLSPTETADMCASFQRVVVTTLVERTFTAARRYQAASVGVSGGVSANSRLRSDLKAYGNSREIPTFVPSLKLSTDNAAMIAAAGLRKLKAGITSPLDINADAALPL